MVPLPKAKEAPPDFLVIPLSDGQNKLMLYNLESG